MKKVLLFGIALILSFSFLGVFAEGILAASVKVDIRVEGPENTILELSDYSVKASDNGKVTAASAFTAALKDSNIKFECFEDYCYFTVIDGYEEMRINGVYIGWSYGINGVPVDNDTKNAELKNGDSLVLYYGDMRKAFPSLYIQINEDNSISVYFTYSGDDSQWQHVEKAPLAGALVYWDGKRYLTDNNGKIVVPVAFAAGGEHSVSIRRYNQGITLPGGEKCPNLLRFPHDYTVSFINFTDLNNYIWAKKYIYNLVYLGVINGITADTFAPGDNLTRAQLVKMLCVIKGANIDKYKGYSYFKDVEKDDWYTPYVNWAWENSVTTGINFEEFGPNDPITRQDFVTMLYRFSVTEGIELGDSGVSSDFSDVDSISDYALESVEFMFKAGIINGYKDNGIFMFKPKNYTTRAEGAKMLAIFYEQYN